MLLLVLDEIDRLDDIVTERARKREREREPTVSARDKEDAEREGGKTNWCRVEEMQNSEVSFLTYSFSVSFFRRLRNSYQLRITDQTGH